MADVIRIHDESIHGIAYWDIKRQARLHQLQSVHRGLYVPAPTVIDAAGSLDRQTASEQVKDDYWRNRLAAHLERGGPMSAISHRGAARLHGLEGFDRRAEDITVATTCGWKQSPAIRSNSLRSDEVTHVDGLRVTTVLRTLLDVGRFVPPDVLELGLEHALRGSDRRRPRDWNEELLAALLMAIDVRRVPRSLRVVLDRRGLQPPTGSYAETLLAQGVRRRRIDGFVRQAVIEVLGVEKRWVFYPDFADLNRGLLIEVDGRKGHEGADNVDRDDRRQNLLSEGFRILRFHARTVIANPDKVAATIAAVQASMPIRPKLCRLGGATVELTATGAQMTIHVAGGR